MRKNIQKVLQKVLSMTAIAALLTTYSAPLGFCSASVPQIDTGIGIQKPVLRENSQVSTLKLEGDISISKANPKVTLSLRDSDSKQVLRMFADKAGLNIIFHSSVDAAGTSSGSSGSSSGTTTPSGPKVTMDLVNVPLNDAFRMVLQVANLTYYLDGNTLIIADANAAQKLNMSKQELLVVPVKYVDAGSLAKFLNKNVFSINKPGLSNAEIAVTNPESNEILIFGTKNDYLMAKKVVAQFDKKPLEETFVVNHTTPKEMADQICNVLLKTPSGSAASSSSSSSGGGSGTDLSLGAGTIACQYNNPITGTTLNSLDTNNLTISYFPQKGTISAVGGSTQQHELIKEFITKNDKKQPQAYMEISIIELNEDGSRAFNNNWKIWSDFFTGEFDGATTHTSDLYPQFIKGDGYRLVDGKFPPTTLAEYYPYRNPMMITYSMSYLIKNGKGRVLANPRILITNGQTSKIDLVSDYVSKVDATTTTTTTQPVVTYKYSIASDNGIQVELTPYISMEGYVTLNIKPQYATIAEKIPGKGTYDAGMTVATLLNKRNLDLKNIRIKDGETLTIGGLINEEEHKNVAKIPVLGDLPGVGMFFRNTDTTKVRHELVIMITPKIIKDSEDVVSNPNMTL